MQRGIGMGIRGGLRKAIQRGILSGIPRGLWILRRKHTDTYGDGWSSVYVCITNGATDSYIWRRMELLLRCTASANGGVALMWTLTLAKILIKYYPN